MSKLYVFGCSFSGLHGMDLLRNEDMKKYYDYRGGNFPPTWSELLAKDLELELVNKACWGSDNYKIFEEFCKNVDNIQSNDIVIIGWSGVNRFRLYSEMENNLLSVNPWTTNKNNKFVDISKNTLDEIIVNRNNFMWVSEVYNWMKVINRLSKLIGFKLHYWSFFNEFNEMYVINNVLNLGADYITQETKGQVYNDHFGEKGHKVQSEYFKEILLKKETKKII